MLNLSKFSENLLDLMTERNLKCPALAKILQTDRSNFTRYLNGEQLPSFKVFVSIIDYFCVSADVILGLKDYSAYSTFNKCQNFCERLRLIMQETKTTQYKIENDLKISGASMYNWLHGKTLPSVDSLIRLAKYMEISVDYLLGRTN